MTCRLMVRLKWTRVTSGGGRKGKRGRGAAGKVPVFDLIKNFWNQGQAHLAKTQWHPLQKLPLVSEGM